MIRASGTICKEFIVSYKSPIPTEKEVRNKVLLDLVISPLTLIPIVGGLTSALAGFAIGSAGWLVGGLIACMVGTGLLLQKIFLNFEGLVQMAGNDLIKAREESLESELDELEEKLGKDRDKSPEDCLRELRALRQHVREGSGYLAGEVANDFERVFHACIDKIKETYLLWKSSRSVTGDSRKALMEQRKKIVVEIQKTTVGLVDLIKQHKTLQTQRSSSELDQLHTEFQKTMEVARRTEERMANLGDLQKNYDPKEFE